jgi:hypothetical protein
MKRSTTRWTTALAAVALLGLPAAGLAQTAASPQQQQPAAAQSEQNQPSDHLRAAKSALAEIDEASVTGRAKTQLTQLKQHLNALERAAAAKTSAANAPAAQARSNNWSTELSAADRILTEMLRPASASGTAGATGTSGTTGAAAAVTVDDVTRAKLTEVRTHLVKFAAAMGGSAAPSADAPAASATASPSPTSPATGTPTTQPPTSQPPTSQPPTATPDNPQQQPSAQAQVDTEAVRRHLTEARETLSEMTQLPAAATLAGDTRTQVNSLIANFNELITNQTDWRASYKKVEDNLNALIGPEDAMAPGTPATGTAGAVGTSGTPTIDAEIRAKLIELRAKLNEFERAAGGASAAGAASADAASAASRAPSAASPSAAQDPSHGSQIDRAEALRHLEAIEAILNGTNAAAPGTAGTSGTTAAPTTTSGAPLTLSRSQLEQLRTHLNELKRVVGEK